MAVPQVPTPHSILQTQVQAELDRLLQSCPVKPYEHMIVSANDRGEIRLSGLVEHPQLVHEAIRLISRLPCVRRVICDVVVMYAGQDVKL